MDIIKTFNPANNNITKDEIDAMRDLTDDQIKLLAASYPNNPSGNAYLVYYMKNEKEEDQRYPLGTWSNLAGLRKLGRKDIVAFNFRKLMMARPLPKTEQPKQRVVDLSAKEALEAEGLKKPLEIKEVQESAELSAAKKELAEAIAAKAHHATIRKLEKKVNSLLN